MVYTLSSDQNADFGNITVDSDFVSYVILSQVIKRPKALLSLRT